MNTPYNLELFAFFSELRGKPVPDDFCDQVFDRFDIDLLAAFGNTSLKNPILVDCNEFESTFGEIDQIIKSGFGGVILKDIDCNDNQNCYLESLSKFINGNLPVYGSIKVDYQEYNKDNLRNIASKIVDAGIKSLIISSSLYDHKLELYKESIEVVKEITEQTFFRINNAVMDYSSRMVLLEYLYAAGADGVVIKDEDIVEDEGKNRLIEWIKNAREVPLRISIASSVSCGSDIFDFLEAGAQCVQVTDFNLLDDDYKKYGSKFVNAFYELILDPEDGLISSIIKEKK